MSKIFNIETLDLCQSDNAAIFNSVRSRQPLKFPIVRSILPFISLSMSELGPPAKFGRAAKLLVGTNFVAK